MRPSGIVSTMINVRRLVDPHDQLLAPGPPVVIDVLGARDREASDIWSSPMPTIVAGLRDGLPHRKVPALLAARL